jgi:SnoaL-like polyketide cyclase
MNGGHFQRVRSGVLTMKLHIIGLFGTFSLASQIAISSHSYAQIDAKTPEHKVHHYTPYEQPIYENASTFHKNFNNREFEKNRALIVNDLHVDSNGTELRGADAYVKGISRFVEPFPDVKISDLYIVVDGNMASIRFVITGTQKGDLATPGGIIHATNKHVQVDGIEYLTLNKKGKLTDLLTVEDLASLLKQLKN